MYTSPADPTLTVAVLNGGGCSYAANAQLYRNSPSVVGSISDGASNTIAFAEHYAFTPRTLFWVWCTDIVPTAHRPSFADRSVYVFPNYTAYDGYDDVYPITTGIHTVASVRGKTFQAAPPPEQADPALAQTPHASGMLVAFADGSVRTLAPNISETAYWSSVTPNGGEQSANEW